METLSRISLCLNFPLQAPERSIPLPGKLAGIVGPNTLHSLQRPKHLERLDTTHYRVHEALARPPIAPRDEDRSILEHLEVWG